MATTYNPRLITSGLHACFDAANPKSYPGSGNKWYDLHQGKQGTLNNGVTWASTWVGQTRWPTQGIYIGRDLNDSNYFFTGYIAMFRAYTVALSHAQLDENFATIRGRYGL